MKNIFIKLKASSNLKQQSLRRMLAKDEEESDKPHPLLDPYFQEQEHSDQDNAHLIIKLIQHHSEIEIKEKLYPVLVYYTASLQDVAVQDILQSVFKSSESIFSRVKFFSLFYKSVSSKATKKWLITRSIALIEQESKISIFSNFVENFDALLAELSFNDNQYVEINLKLINYLEKHLVYKKLWKHYIVQTLLKTSANNAATPEVDALIVKLLKNAEITQETVALTSRKELVSNKLYPFLQLLLLGDFEAFNTSSKGLLSSAGVNLVDLERNIKIQAIPRILNGIKNASYSQVSEILKIQKPQVESYIIEAIQNGLLKAKIDEFQETILIHQVKFRALRPEDSASLQKNISTLAGKLEQIASTQ